MDAYAKLKEEKIFSSNETRVCYYQNDNFHFIRKSFFLKLALMVNVGI